MANIEKIVCTWTGFIGAPGYTVFYAKPGGGMQPFVKSFWTALSTYIPANTTVSTPNNGEVLDEATGKMNGVWSYGTSGTQVMTGTGAYAPQAGALIRWLTGGFDNGRAIRGRTFIVPLTSGQYTTSGVLLTTAQNAIAAAANTLWSSGGGAMVVWHRPVYNNASPPVLTRPGFSFPITSSNCSSTIATLTSRRNV